MACSSSLSSKPEPRVNPLADIIGLTLPFWGSHSGHPPVWGSHDPIVDISLSGGPFTPPFLGSYEQALVSLKLKKSIDAVGRTFAVIIEGG